MKLEDYFLMRNGLNMKGQPKKALSKGEARILGLDMNKKGWAKTDEDYSEDIIKKCVHHVLKSDWINVKARNKISELTKFFDFFRRTSSPEELMKRREDREFIEALKEMALTVEDGRMTNHGLSEYGAQKLYESGREPNALEQRVLLADGTFISYNQWKANKE